MRQKQTKQMACQPEIHVGIMSSDVIIFELNGDYFINTTTEYITGLCHIHYIDERSCNLLVGNESKNFALPVMFTPQHAHNSFELRGVTIGINFHWERKESQLFTGQLKFMEESRILTAINIVPLEDYLRSVISSEMSATSSPELLKAHAVISRSWLMAQVEQRKKIKNGINNPVLLQSDTEHIRWYGREDHQNYDVCADDHCQRYQGITRTTTKAVDDAINRTYGQVLVYEDEICDARYSKCCGGITEKYENVWETTVHAYLTKVIDNIAEPRNYDTRLDTEEKALRWIKDSPEAFCNTRDIDILNQALNNYDQETANFYRWQVSIGQDELIRLLNQKINLNVGKVIDLVPVERGESGRLIRLLIKGTDRSVIIGKELEIRKALSSTHLYSSAFVVEKSDIEHGIPQTFVLYGAGWGHGVGLCQIGAAVMAEQQFTYVQILQHYFRGASLEKKYF